MKYVIGILAAILILMIAGCSAPTCYPPNKILGNNCCLDEDGNDVCDYEETAEEEPEVVEEAPEEVELEEEEPQIQQVEMPKTVEPAVPRTLQVGKQDIKLGEPRKYLEINKMTAYRTSRDKGIMDYMIFTVRNIGQAPMSSEVELLFEGARVEDHSTKVKKAYTVPELKPGEKYVFNQSLGIRYAEIDKTKKMTMTLYPRFVAPRDAIDTLKKEFVPQDLFETMEIFTYGLPEE